MENSINRQFKMNQGAHAENNTETSFRNPEKVAQAGGITMMADPINYGTADTPALSHEPGHESTFDKVKNYVRNSSLNIKTTRPDSDRTTESSRIFGPTDEEIANQKRIREKRRKQQAEIDAIKAGNS